MESFIGQFIGFAIIVAIIVAVRHHFKSKEARQTEFPSVEPPENPTGSRTKRK